MSILKAVVPVAGLGTRLLPATKSQPKEMLPVAKKPVVQYVVEELEANGIDQVLLVTGKNKTSIENHFDFDNELMRTLRENGKEEMLGELEYERMPMQFFFTRQRRQKGLGDAVLCAKKFTQDSPFAVALGDSILSGTSRVVSRMCDIFAETGASCVVAVEEISPEGLSSKGVVKPDSEIGAGAFLIEDLIEKPSIEEAPSNLAIAARYVFGPEIYPALEKTKPGKGGEIQLTDAIRLLLEQDCKVVGVRLGRDEKRHDIGDFESYFKAFITYALDEYPHLWDFIQGLR